MHRDHPLLPIAVTTLAIALFSIMDAFMKRAAIAGGVYSALLVRALLAGIVTALIWRARGGRQPAPEVMKVHALRGVVCTGMAATFFYGLVRLPMAQAIAISFIAPLIALYLAAVMLGERIRRAAVIAAVLGLAGVAVIASERTASAAELEGEAVRGIAAVLLSAMLYAWNLVLQRRQAQIASPIEIAVFQNLFVALSLLPFAPWLWHMPGAGGFADIAGAALLATLALMLLAWAYARAEAQVLVPIEYTAFVWAALMGWWWFGEGLATATLAGVVLILAGCWLSARRRGGPVLA